MKRLILFLIGFAFFGQVEAQQFCTPNPITSDTEFEGIFAEGEYSVLPRTGQPCTGGANNILKPVILTGTFDFFHQFTINNLYWQYFQVIDYLRDSGYDVILLEFDNANLKVQNNALLMQTLINLVNNIKLDPNEPLIVAGHGLGGLISRYCLASMEENGFNHQTRLYISLDAPHQGMYIPLSIQFFIDKLDQNLFFLADQNNFELLQEVEALYDSPISRQLLKFQWSATEELILSPSFSDFQDELNSLNDCNGYPTQSRNVAIAFGSWEEDYENEIFHPQQTVNGFDMVPGLPAILVNHNCEQNTDFNIHIEFDVLTPDADITCPHCPETWLTSGFLFNQFDIFGFMNEQKLAYVPGSMIEVAPGSNIDYYGQIEDIIDDYSITICSELISAESCFMPTVSALDYRTDDYFADIKGNPNKLDNTPFDNIFGFTENHSHIGNDLFGTDILLMLEFLQNELENDLGYSCGQYQRVLSGVSISSGSVVVEDEVSIIVADNYTMGPGANVSFFAGERIELNDGFVANQGSSFVAEIVPCSSKPCHWTSPSEPAFRPQAPGSHTYSVDSSIHSNKNTPNDKETNVQEQDVSMLIYPNPNNGDFKVVGFNMVKVEVYSAMGMLVDTYSPNNTQLIITDLSQGVYLVRAYDTQGKPTTKRVVVY